jgi:hypothetical protein
MKRRTAYHRGWHQRHPDYKAAQARLRAMLKPSRRAFYRELLGIRVRVNLLGKSCAAPKSVGGDQ